MSLQQSFQNPYSRIQQKRYGYEYPQTSWLNRNGKRLGAAMCALSALGVVGGCIVLALYVVAR